MRLEQLFLEARARLDLVPNLLLEASLPSPLPSCQCSNLALYEVVNVSIGLAHVKDK